MLDRALFLSHRGLTAASCAKYQEATLCALDLDPSKIFFSITCLVDERVWSTHKDLNWALVLLQSRYNPFPDLPFAGNGTCDLPTENEDGTTTVRCLGPAHPLKPGQVQAFASVSTLARRSLSSKCACRSYKKTFTYLTLL